MQDIISRQSAIDLIENLVPQNTTEFSVLFQVRELIRQLPPLEASGEWIENPNAYECSNCHIIRAKGMTGKYNYCPNCGALMKNAESENK